MNKGEKLLYQDNKSGYKLILAFIVLNTFITIFVLRSMTINTAIGVFVMYNIVLSLVSFLAAIKVKKYSMGYAVFSLALGVLQFIVSFNMPKLSDPGRNTLVTLLTIAEALIVITAGVITIIKSKIRKNYLLQRKA